MSQPAPAAAPLAFEVATIKPSEPITGMGGKVMVRIGVRNDGAMVSYARMSLRALVQNAYGVKDYQVTGASWMDTLQFDISAKLPDGASKDDAPEMLKTLLKERFKVSIHIEKKDHPIYALVVGKSGPKLKVAETNASEKSAATPREPGSAAPPPPPPPPSGGGRGGGTAVFAMSDGGGRGGPPSGGMSMRMDGSGGHIEGRDMTLTRFAETLSRFLDRPVIDQTAIEGSYDFKIDMSAEEMGKHDVADEGDHDGRPRRWPRSRVRRRRSGWTAERTRRRFDFPVDSTIRIKAGTQEGADGYNHHRQCGENAVRKLGSVHFVDRGCVKQTILYYRPISGGVCTTDSSKQNSTKIANPPAMIIV